MKMPPDGMLDALVGLSFLTRFRVGLDFEAWEMELTPPRRIALSPGPGRA